MEMDEESMGGWERGEVDKYDEWCNVVWRLNAIPGSGKWARTKEKEKQNRRPRSRTQQEHKKPKTKEEVEGGKCPQ